MLDDDIGLCRNFPYAFNRNFHDFLDDLLDRDFLNDFHWFFNDFLNRNFLDDRNLYFLYDFHRNFLQDFLDHLYRFLDDFLYRNRNFPDDFSRNFLHYFLDHFHRNFFYDFLHLCILATPIELLGVYSGR